MFPHSNNKCTIKIIFYVRWICLIVCFPCRIALSETVAAEFTVSDELPIFICRESLSTAKKIIRQGYRCGLFVCTSFLYTLIPRSNFSFTEYFIAVLYTIMRHHNQHYFHFLSLYRNIKTVETKWKRENTKPNKTTWINDAMEVHRLCKTE